MLRVWSGYLILSLLGIGAIVSPVVAQPPTEPSVPPPDSAGAPIGSLPNETAPLESAPPAWFVEAELGVVKPAFTRLATTPDGRRDTFLGQINSASLDWTVLPEVAAGYRFAGGGSFRIAYRYLNSTGHQRKQGPNLDEAYPEILDGMAAEPFFINGGAPAVRYLDSKLEEHWLDLDYVAAPRLVGGTGWWNWTTGVRLASLSSDFHARDNFFIAIGARDSGQLLADFPFTVFQHASNHSYAGGGHLGLEGGWSLGITGLSLFGRADGGLLGSTNKQKFGIGAEASLAGVMPGGPSFAVPEMTASTQGPGIIPTLNLQAGLNWSVPIRQTWVSLALGYELQGWWFIATGDHASDNALFTHIDTLTHGPFLRCEFDY